MAPTTVPSTTRRPMSQRCPRTVLTKCKGTKGNATNMSLQDPRCPFLVNLVINRWHWLGFALFFPICQGHLFSRKDAYGQDSLLSQYGFDSRIVFSSLGFPWLTSTDVSSHGVTSWKSRACVRVPFCMVRTPLASKGTNRNPVSSGVISGLGP